MILLISPEGYPEGYLLGLSSFFLIICLTGFALMSLRFFLNAKKSPFQSMRQMFKVKGVLYFGTTISLTIGQIGVFFPENYFLINILGLLIIDIIYIFYFYYWELNLTSIKHIPTISAILSAIFMTLTFFFTILFSYKGIMALIDLLMLISIVFTTICFILYIYLIISFTQNVEGENKTIGYVWSFGMVLVLMGVSSFTPFGAIYYPEIFVLYFSSLISLLGGYLAYFGVNKFFFKTSSYYSQTHKCAVHRGEIKRGEKVYFCPSCGISYCESCHTQVIQNDGCWNCGAGGKEQPEFKFQETTLEEDLLIDEVPHKASVKEKNVD